MENEPKQDWFLNQALKNKPTIVTNSNHARIKFEQVYGKENDLDIQTIYNGIDIRPIDNNINWIDINDLEVSKRISGKSHEQLIRRLHVIKDGEVYAGTKAFIIMWRNIPKYKWLGNFVALPLVYQISVVAYEIIALFLFIKNRHQLNEKK